MNINTLSSPALAHPASPLPHAAARNTQAAHPFATLMQQAHQATGHRIPSHLSEQARGLSAQAALNHAP